MGGGGGGERERERERERESSLTGQLTTDTSTARVQSFRANRLYDRGHAVNFGNRVGGGEGGGGGGGGGRDCKVVDC